MFIDNIPDNTEVLYSTDYALNSDDLYLYFAKNKGAKYNFFFKLYKKENGINICMGYIYFTISREKRISNFIGVYVNHEYRSLGISSFLISQWINFCFNEGLDFLGTIKRQRKPFLLYLIKTFGFEILDPLAYEQASDTIFICRKSHDNRKFLLFKDPIFQDNFMHSAVASADNYAIINSEDEYEVLDQVMLMRKYNLQDYDKASQKTIMVLERCKK